MFDSRDVLQHRCETWDEKFWRVGIARNAVFFQSVVASRVRKGRSEQRGGAKDRLPKMSTKFAPRLRARAISARKIKHHAACSEHFVKLSFAKCAPRLRVRASQLVGMSFLKEVSRKSFVFELQSFIFEGSRFGASKLHVWRKSRTKASFLSFKASFLKEVSHKSFVFELQSFISEGSLAQKLRLTKSVESHIDWQPNHLNLKSFDIQIAWISNQLTTNSFESQIDWQPTHLNLKSIDEKIIWISDQLTTNSLESQIHWQPNYWISNQLTTKIIWTTHQLTTKSFDIQITWIWHQLTFEPLELHTPCSSRFLIFGNFRHRLVR